MRPKSSTSEVALPRVLIEIADDLRARARTGLHYATDQYNRHRYEEILELAIRLASLGSGVELTEIDALYRATDTGYLTPKLDVRMAIFRDERVLLVRERADGRWALPGGYVDVGDSPGDAAVRETWEEAGVRVRASRLVGVFDPRVRPEAPPQLFHIHKLVFAGELLEPSCTPAAGHEVEEARFHPICELPELSRARTLPFHIEQALRIVRDPTAPPYFD